MPGFLPLISLRIFEPSFGFHTFDFSKTPEAEKTRLIFICLLDFSELRWNSFKFNLKI